MKRFFTSLLLFAGVFVFVSPLFAMESARVITKATAIEEEPINATAEATSSSIVIENLEPIPSPKPDLTQRSVETTEPLKKLLDEQELGRIFPYNPIKYAVRGAVDSGVPPNTLVLLLLLPGVAALIGAARHLVGLRGFGIFLPAALSIVFVATGPIVGIGLFLTIVFISTATRISLRSLKIKLQYLPRMALLLHFVVMGILAILFLAPVIRQPNFANVSIFPVLVLVLLAEDFTRIQLGKSVKVAVNLALETLILALGSYLFLSLKSIQEYALLNPEIWIIAIAAFDVLVGKYVGLRFIELWRFRKLIAG